MNDPILVLCNVPDISWARKLANSLLAAQLCACVNLLPGVESLYIWEGKLEQSTEVTMLIKTTQGCYSQLEQIIKQNHPYQVPEIISCEISQGLPEYLSWIRHSVNL